MHSTSLDDLRTPPQAAPPTSPSSRPSHTVTLPASRASVAGAHPQKSQPPVHAQSPDTLAGVKSNPSPTTPLPAHLHRLHLINHSSYLPPPPRSSPTLSLSPHNSNSKRLSFVFYSDLLIDLIFDYNPLRTTLDVGICASYVFHCIGTNVTTTPSNIFFGLCTFLCAIAAFHLKQLSGILSDNNMSDEDVMPWRKLMFASGVNTKASNANGSKMTDHPQRTRPSPDEAAAQFNAQRRLRLHTRIPITYCIMWCIMIPRTPHPHPASTSQGEGQAATL
ncbi:hypothetical protein M422DRAFT_264027 [Sphaerobolus stellatus SS14]|uniref:Uncharacterized protein n=1 Tax=Sphaerobolus stellatus (strain SS14) TaxID=990650 RepID=A0A0C9UGL2_SPHS4|nr:hypothetical protein M422DRAFT_264027 [Sphaerobolus stellatus SS14]